MEPTVKSIEHLYEKAARMQAYLVETYDSKDGEGLIQRLEFLQIMVAESGQLLSDARWYQDGIVNGAIQQAIKDSYEKTLSPSTINKFVNTASKNYNYLVNVYDRINATATHQIKSIITILSYRKAEMQL